MICSTPPAFHVKVMVWMKIWPQISHLWRWINWVLSLKCSVLCPQIFQKNEKTLELGGVWRNSKQAALPPQSRLIFLVSVEAHCISMSIWAAERWGALRGEEERRKKSFFHIFRHLFRKKNFEKKNRKRKSFEIFFLKTFFQNIFFEEFLFPKKFRNSFAKKYPPNFFVESAFWKSYFRSYHLGVVRRTAWLWMQRLTNPCRPRLVTLSTSYVIIINYIVVQLVVAYVILPFIISLFMYNNINAKYCSDDELMKWWWISVIMMTMNVQKKCQSIGPNWSRGVKNTSVEICWAPPLSAELHQDPSCTNLLPDPSHFARRCHVVHCYNVLLCSDGGSLT